MFRYLLVRLKQVFCPQQHVFLRIAKVNLWEPNEAGDPPTAERVVAGFTLRPGEKCLSLYRLSRMEEAAQLACVFSLTLRDNPRHFEYVVFPAKLLSECRVNPAMVPEFPSFLSERHFEIADSSEEQLLALADRILKSPEKKIERIRKQEIVAFAVQHNMIENEELKDRIHDKWLKLIEKKKSRPADHTSR